MEGFGLALEFGPRVNIQARLMSRDSRIGLEKPLWATRSMARPKNPCASARLAMGAAGRWDCQRLREDARHWRRGDIRARPLTDPAGGSEKDSLHSVASASGP